MMKEVFPLSFYNINPNPEERVAAFENDPSPIILLLDNLEDPRNIGSIFRLADAGRIAGIYGHHTHMEKVRSILMRVSRNTTGHILYREVTSFEQIEELSELYHPVALEYTNKSIPYNQYHSKKPCMLVVGNEKKGVSKEILRLCEISLHIPMLGMNSSMNVSAATAIVLYHLLEVTGRI